MITMFFDTETTGLPDWKSPSDAEHQPHMIQFASMLFRGEQLLMSVNALVRPDGWSISDEISGLTGITNEDADKFGYPEPTVYRLALRMIREADLLVAHNTPFDMRILRIASKRFGSEGEPEKIKAKPTECTMRQASAIMKMPPTDKMKAAGFTKPKPPKLSEAHEHFFGQPLDGAHNAMVDLDACRRIWLHIRAMSEAENAA